MTTPQNHHHRHHSHSHRRLRHSTFFILHSTLALSVFSALCALNTLNAQKLDYANDPSGLLQEQARQVFAQAYKVLDAHPPAATANAAATDERKLALYSLDTLLHDIRLDGTPAFLDYMKIVADRALRTLEAPAPATGLVVQRLYNHGFIIRTPTVTIGIDLDGGTTKKRFIDSARLQAIAKRCDILFITHEHEDHADIEVARYFIQQGKPVIAPKIPDTWPDAPDVTTRLTLLRAADPLDKSILLHSTGAKLSVRIYPGHQGKAENNLYLITTPEGKTIMHTGDQNNADDLKWIARIGDDRPVDILLMQCWCRTPAKFIEGIRPALIITGHENEMNHTIDHREPYWLTYRRFESIPTPAVIMAWGERLDLK